MEDRTSVTSSSSPEVSHSRPVSNMQPSSIHLLHLLQSPLDRAPKENRTLRSLELSQTDLASILMDSADAGVTLLHREVVAQRSANVWKMHFVRCAYWMKGATEIGGLSDKLCADDDFAAGLFEGLASAGDCVI